MFEAFRERLKSPDPRVAEQQDFFTIMFDAMKAATMGAFPIQAKEALNETGNWLSGVESNMWETMFAFYVKAGLLTDEQAEKMMKLKDTCTPMDIIFFIAISLQLLAPI